MIRLSPRESEVITESWQAIKIVGDYKRAKSKNHSSEHNYSLVVFMPKTERENLLQVLHSYKVRIYTYQQTAFMEKGWWKLYTLEILAYVKSKNKVPRNKEKWSYIYLQ